ncbi:hypothetical protein BD779DRAFT_1786915 [Infundibulicybe gibba]|nr:hypothetical protein BD779DRAFT_1786915 [Infundibulicybe gibba]
MLVYTILIIALVQAAVCAPAPAGLAVTTLLPVIPPAQNCTSTPTQCDAALQHSALQPSSVPESLPGVSFANYKASAATLPSVRQGGADQAQVFSPMRTWPDHLPSALALATQKCDGEAGQARGLRDAHAHT